MRPIRPRHAPLSLTTILNNGALSRPRGEMVDFEEPWRYALGPGGHFYDKCAPTVSASCFPNTTAPRTRFVVQHVVEVPAPHLYPTFLHNLPNPLRS